MARSFLAVAAALALLSGEAWLKLILSLTAIYLIFTMDGSGTPATAIRPYNETNSQSADARQPEDEPEARVLLPSVVISTYHLPKAPPDPGLDDDSMIFGNFIHAPCCIPTPIIETIESWQQNYSRPQRPQRTSSETSTNPIYHTDTSPEISGLLSSDDDPITTHQVTPESSIDVNSDHQPKPKIVVKKIHAKLEAENPLANSKLEVFPEKPELTLELAVQPGYVWPKFWDGPDPYGDYDIPWPEMAAPEPLARAIFEEPTIGQDITSEDPSLGERHFPYLAVECVAVECVPVGFTSYASGGLHHPKPRKVHSSVREGNFRQTLATGAPTEEERLFLEEQERLHNRQVTFLQNRPRIHLIHPPYADTDPEEEVEFTNEIRAYVSKVREGLLDEENTQLTPDMYEPGLQYMCPPWITREGQPPLNASVEQLRDYYGRLLREWNWLVTYNHPIALHYQNATPTNGPPPSQITPKEFFQACEAHMNGLDEDRFLDCKQDPQQYPEMLIEEEAEPTHQDPDEAAKFMETFGKYLTGESPIQEPPTARPVCELPAEPVCELTRKASPSLGSSISSKQTQPLELQYENIPRRSQLFGPPGLTGNQQQLPEMPTIEPIGHGQPKVSHDRPKAFVGSGARAARSRFFKEGNAL